ncbi:hypothetical protein HZA56_16105 [Candidatus Poribacteria bacterium]|nr:hypothetical protein [Candidatus Poribacteria bacterium]
MCGIFGVVAGEGCVLPKQSLTDILEFLFLRSEFRGKEASGLAFYAGGEVDVHKCSMRAAKMLRNREFQSFLDSCLKSVYSDDAAPARPFASLGHSRLVTNGIEILDRNNQPVLADASLGVHNGIVVNVDELWQHHPELVRKAEVDTEIIYSLIDKYRSLYGSEEDALRAAFAEIAGSASIAYFHEGAEELCLATNTGSLYICRNVGAGVFLFASEGYSLRLLAKQEFIKELGASAEIRNVHAGHGVAVDIRSCVDRGFSLLRPLPGLKKPAAESKPGGRSFGAKVRARERVNLRRCTRCVLPETFPFIEFDDKGVCSVCNQYERKTLYGRQAIEQAVEKYRSKNGEPDCLVAFSGGRDSAYGLHYIKKELGMNPIAFTYDWGLVSDLARRNQARMCAKLGVEHIIRSPDVRAKRRYVRQNLNAWLHRPDLGMIPLLSAGDKQFYHYGRQLLKETGIRLTFFCADDMERTEFKTGFCGVRENQHRMRLSAYSWKNKLAFLFYYMKQYTLNPRYLNSSLLDTLLSYYSTYVAKDDFLYLYHYIPWDEKTIVTTLMEEYGWEIDPESKSTWRIDDAYIPFHNYIYYTVAGFSEHDTFRSNQIRAGVITREEALAIVERDNQPRIGALRDYASRIGINLEEVMLVVNSIPKLYEKRS